MSPNFLWILVFMPLSLSDSKLKVWQQGHFSAPAFEGTVSILSVSNQQYFMKNTMMIVVVVGLLLPTYFGFFSALFWLPFGLHSITLTQ